MRTKYLLSRATPSNAAHALTCARAVGWTTDQIMRHASPAVLAVLNPPRPQLVRQPTGHYGQVCDAPELLAVVPVKLERKSLTYEGVLDIAPARKRHRGTGSTHNVTAAVPGGHELFTLSPRAVTRLCVGEQIRVWIGGASYLATKQ